MVLRFCGLRGRGTLQLWGFDFVGLAAEGFDFVDLAAERLAAASIALIFSSFTADAAKNV